ncbi:hypothetical protein HZA97_01585 [Candidatus Woesearchaeota archaeon]|nr:hypothetical protein [Candidatus Woesearchaeota archaeon]
MHDYIFELDNVFTSEGIADINFDAEKFEINNNEHAKSLQREFKSISDYLGNQSSTVRLIENK